MNYPEAIAASSSAPRYRDGVRAIMLRSVLEIVRRPLYWIGFFVLPLFCFLFLANEMENGLPMRTPAAIVDLDRTSLSRTVEQNLNGMQLVQLDMACESFTDARKAMQEGKVFGVFVIPRGFQADLLAGRGPVIQFYTNMTYFVPANLLYKTFKTTALYTKAGVALKVLETAGATAEEAMPVLNPVNIVDRPLGNPALNYGVYLCNSFIPGVLQLMIFLVTVFSLGQELKYGTSRRLMQMARGSIIRALFGKLLPQTVIWLVVVFFMESWLFGWNGYPMNGSWFWITLSEVLFVLAAQGMAVFIFGILPNLRLSLSVCALIGVLTFSIAAFSFPVQSMYGPIGIFSWIVPVRYNFMIYINTALNGLDFYWSRWWYAAYVVFMLLPFTFLWRIKKAMLNPVYVP